MKVRTKIEVKPGQTRPDQGRREKTGWDKLGGGGGGGVLCIRKQNKTHSFAFPDGSNELDKEISLVP